MSPLIRSVYVAGAMVGGAAAGFAVGVGIGAVHLARMRLTGRQLHLSG